jgi:integrase
VFATTIGTPRDYRNELRRFQSVARKCGLEGGFHALRHSAATALVDAGVPLPTVSRILGHARASITLDVHGHALPDSTMDALTRLAATYES